MNESEALLKFPCQFPIKAVGKSNLEFDLLVFDIIRRHAPDVNDQKVSTRPSKDGNYLAVTVVIQASSKAQLDAIYQDLSDHPEVLMAL